MDHGQGNCLDLHLTDAPGIVNCVVDPPLGNSDHSSISFTLQLGAMFTIALIISIISRRVPTRL